MKQMIINIHELLAKSKINCIAKTYNHWIMRGAKTLDVGCGNGVIANGLKNLLSISITGCDREQYLLHNMPYIPMTQEDALPFDAASFDTIMFNDVLHHTAEKNQKTLLKEAVRVTKRNIVIFEANPTMMTYISDYLINKVYHYSMPLPLTFQSMQTWHNIFRTLPVHIETAQVKRPFFSPFSRVAFNLIKYK